MNGVIPVCTYLRAFIVSSVMQRVFVAQYKAQKMANGSHPSVGSRELAYDDGIDDEKCGMRRHGTRQQRMKAV